MHGTHNAYILDDPSLYLVCAICEHAPRMYGTYAYVLTYDSTYARTLVRVSCELGPFCAAHRLFQWLADTKRRYDFIWPRQKKTGVEVVPVVCYFRHQMIEGHVGVDEIV